MKKVIKRDSRAKPRTFVIPIKFLGLAMRVGKRLFVLTPTGKIEEL